MKMEPAPRARLDRYYFFIVALIIAGLVAYGFSRTIGERLLHPPAPPPAILYVHALIFTGWIVLFVTQTALIGTRNVKTHRKLGLWGIALGVSLPIVGVATAIVMGRLHVQQGEADAAAFLAIPLQDVVAFAAAFGMAVYWRKKPEFHRRLMLIATCTLTAAAFGRLVPADAADGLFYVGVDVLISLGVARDWIVARRVHPVYRYGFPAILLGQAIAVYLDTSRSPAWLSVAHRLIG